MRRATAGMQVQVLFQTDYQDGRGMQEEWWAGTVVSSKDRSFVFQWSVTVGPVRKRIP
jgi:hypothetical protein